MTRSNAQTSYTVTYNASSHWSILTQMWGSKWPQVLPYCIFNVALMVTLIMVDHRFGGKYNIQISTQGHTFVTLVVAFLLVSRVNIALDRYNKTRDSLEVMCKECRELVQSIVVFSSECQNEQAREWRHEVAYRALLMLRTAMAVIDYPTTNVPAWDVPELNGEEAVDVRRSMSGNPANRRWSHGSRSLWDETMRVPPRVAFLTRKSIHSQATRLSSPIPVNLEVKMLANVDGFMNGYYGISRFLTTPVPFPLVQMARTFLFLYVFTVPFVMLRDNSGDFAHCFSVFLLTYGFIGLEMVAIELDDPFGDDANDFNNLAMAMTAFEDVYLTIVDVDGATWADKLRYRMHDKANDVALPTEQSWLLGPSPV